MSKHFRRREAPALDRQKEIRKENVKIKAEAVAYLFPYPGQNQAVAMKGRMPNRWWRWWHWVLLGWRWEEKAGD